MSSEGDFALKSKRAAIQKRFDPLVGIAMVTASRGEAGAGTSGEPAARRPPRRPPAPPLPGKVESIVILNTFLQLGGNSRWKNVF